MRAQNQRNEFVGHTEDQNQKMGVQGAILMLRKATAAALLCGLTAFAALHAATEPILSADGFASANRSVQTADVVRDIIDLFDEIIDTVGDDSEDGTKNP